MIIARLADANNIFSLNFRYGIHKFIILIAFYCAAISFSSLNVYFCIANKTSCRVN